jgi:hypothetical protein
MPLSPFVVSLCALSDVAVGVKRGRITDAVLRQPLPFVVSPSIALRTGYVEP